MCLPGDMKENDQIDFLQGEQQDRAFPRQNGDRRNSFSRPMDRVNTRYYNRRITRCRVRRKSERYPTFLSNQSSHVTFTTTGTQQQGERERGYANDARS